MQSIKALFTPQYKKQIMIGIVLQVGQQLSGINAVMFYSSTIFRYDTKPEQTQGCGYLAEYRRLGTKLC
jgi:hypothetical protein